MQKMKNTETGTRIYNRIAKSMKNQPELFAGPSKNSKVFLRAQKHSQYIRFLKLLLPVIAIVLASVFSWIAFFSETGSTDIIILNSADEQDNRLVMTAPKVEGYTKDNKPYIVQAARASHDPRHSGVIELENIRAVLPLGVRGQAVINAHGGFFDNINGRVQFVRPFVVQTADGITARLLSGDINMETSQMKTTDKVEIRSTTEFLTANGMRILDRGNVIMFDGGVRLVIDRTAGQMKQSDVTLKE